ncbi:hypothetical protein TNCV_4844581 [Trichonephila clavipes]|uniref:Uncharacterized protein n=1 Tax=Trichonephila clavipes TaxID=2585209 RepID=A0A8X6WLT2_TRICX|nr:hypothetical protein TNCV_4844581 [Trichonephila clavipes]
MLHTRAINDGLRNYGPPSSDEDDTMGLGSNPGEDMDAGKFIGLSWHGGTLNSHRAACPLVGLVEGKERWEVLDPPTGGSSSKSGGNRAKSYCHLYGAQGYGQRQAYI